MPQFRKREEDTLSSGKREVPAALTDRQLRERGVGPRFSKVAFGAALVTLVVGAFASFGGMGYAATSAKHGLRGAAHAVSTQAPQRRVTLSAADAQYSPEKTVKPGKTVGSKLGVLKPPKVVPPASPTTTGTLPFTGLSLAGTLAVAVAFIALGLILRRRERRSS